MKRTLASILLGILMAAFAPAQAAQQKQEGARPPAKSDAAKPEPAKPEAVKLDPAALKQYAGRYELDPKEVENFVMDVTVENGELWAKPSHQDKHRLVMKSKDEFSDDQGLGVQLKFKRDEKGVVVAAIVDQGGLAVEARKLVLPPPSLAGKITFRLKGYPDARVVALAGSFNNWNQSQTLFAREGDEWVCRIDLPPGKYTYKFVIDGNWITDPNNLFTQEDDRGNTNSVLVVEAK